MKVRDKTKKKSEYLGRDTEAVDSVCPCRKCYSPHDLRTRYDGKPDIRKEK